MQLTGAERRHMREIGPRVVFAAAMERANIPGGESLGIAISGGGDSTALAVLAADWAAARGVTLHAISVDHGLRPEAGAEIDGAARLCAILGITHERRNWTGWDGQGNLQDQARRARRRLIADWARDLGIGRVALGHTMDDQAETLLRNLARGSGVDGLAAMPEVREAGGVLWLRPLLDIRRADLRDLLREAGVSWSDDPSNDDPRYDRVRTRQAIATLGLDVERLADTARRMGQAREVVRIANKEAAARLLRIEAGDVLLSPDVLAEPGEIRDRLISDALCWVSNIEYKPRHDGLTVLIRAMAAGEGATLHGCLVTPGRDGFRIGREPARVEALRCRMTEVWDNRWVIKGIQIPGFEIAALGEAGLAARPNWRDSGLPRATLIASPAVWSGHNLISAPLIERDGPYSAELLRPTVY